MEQRPKLAHYSILFLIYGVAAATLAAHIFGHRNISLAQGATCQSNSNTVIVELRDNQFVPSAVKATRCDSLVIINNDKIAHEPALGQHPEHIHYPGFAERPLAPSQSMSFQLSQAGDFELHDHLQPDMQASLIIKE